MTEIKVNAEKIFKILAAIILFLIVASLIAGYLKLYFNYEKFRLVKQFVRVFVFDEGSVHTWYSSSLFLCCSFLLSVIAYVKKRINAQYLNHWTLLSIIFVFLSIDEICEFHERLSFFQVMIGDVAFKYTWVLFAIPFVIILFFTYLKFIIHLPQEIRKVVILAGVLFIGGTLGIEIVGGLYSAFHNNKMDIIYLIFGTLEESLEMLGTAIFIYALLTYINSHLSNLKIYIDNSGSLTELDLHIRKKSQQSFHENKVKRFNRIAIK